MNIGKMRCHNVPNPQSSHIKFSSKLFVNRNYWTILILFLFYRGSHGIRLQSRRVFARAKDPYKVIYNWSYEMNIAERSHFSSVWFHSSPKLDHTFYASRPKTDFLFRPKPFRFLRYFIIFHYNSISDFIMSLITRKETPNYLLVI